MDSIISLLLAPISAPHLSRFAYLDPGSGSIILQVIAAAVLGGLFIIKGYWSKIRSFFRRDKGGSDSPDDK